MTAYRIVVTGVVKDNAEVARLDMVSRREINQIMNQQLLAAPDNQEEILFLPKTMPLPDQTQHLQPICLEVDLGKSG